MIKPLRINNQIRVPEVRLVGEKGEQLGVFPIAKALDLARTNSVDLVEVAPTAVPPVCRMLDYGKYRYEQTKKERQSKKSQKISELKEMRLRPKIGDHDMEAKMRFIKKFLADGDKVKVTVMFRGREITHADLGYKLLQKVIQLLDGVGTVEKQPVMEGRRMFIIMTAVVAAPKSKPRETQDAKTKNP